MLSFLFPSLMAGIAIAILAGPLGAFVVWRKMSYFGDTLAHASLLGVVIGLMLNINIHLALILCCVLLAVVLVFMQKQKLVETDTLLGILSHSALSIGLVAVSFLDNVRVDLMSYLFGDLLAISANDLAWIYLGTFTVLGLIIKFWHPLLSMSVSEELAQVEGVNIERMRLLLMVVIGIVIAVAMQYVGALIITSMLIIPAATARRFAPTPELMAIGASCVGILSMIMGLCSSWSYDTPAGPSVVVCAALLFAISQLVPSKK